jgi:arabinose-5-phosphate isomerase
MKNLEESVINIGRDTLRAEADSLRVAETRLDSNFAKAIDIIMNSKGRVVVTGMGKSGHIGQKIASTLSSTGTPSFFMHPAEGVHGDLGMLVRGDVVIALSNSGETEEIKQILPIIKRFSLKLISITGNMNSTLAGKSDAVLNSGVEREACPMNLAPTSSTTVSLALGDALAVALVHERGFKDSDFAVFHPSGTLGRKLLLRVEDLWHSGNELPVASIDTPLKDLLYIISSKGFGVAAITENDGRLAGIITDGDLRRAMENYTNISDIHVANIMSKDPKLITPDDLAASALAIMEKYSITSLIVASEDKKPMGLIHMHDLIRVGLI